MKAKTIIAIKPKWDFFSQESSSFFSGVSCFKTLFDESESLLLFVFLLTGYWFLSVPLLRIWIIPYFFKLETEVIGLSIDLKLPDTLFQKISSFKKQQVWNIKYLKLLWFVIYKITKQCKCFFKKNKLFVCTFDLKIFSY